MTLPNEAFFRRDGDLLIPNPSAKGPWGNAGLHGRVIAGLLGVLGQIIGSRRRSPS